MRRRLDPPRLADFEGPARALLVTQDHELLDAVLRLAAATGVSLDVAHESVAARRCWARAPLVVVAYDMLGPLAAAGLPRRPAVLIVGRQRPDETVWQHAVAIGAEQALLLPDAESVLLDRLAESAEPRTAARAVGVIGGQGGAGASVLAATLACGAARRGLAPLLVDADPLGGGLDLVVGAEAEPGLRWPDLTAVRGRLQGTRLRESLPELDGLWVLSHVRGDSATRPSVDSVRAVVDGGRRGFDLVVVDLPRHFDESSTAALCSCDVVLIVVRDQLRAVAAAAVVAEAVGRCAADVRVVVRTQGRSGLGVNAVASGLGLPCAGEMPHLPSLVRDLDAGVPPGRASHNRLGRLRDKLLDELAPASAAA